MNYKKTIITAAITCSLFTGSLVGEAATFTDVPHNASYKQAVDQLVKFNVLSGYSDGTFKPHALVTRAQAASIMAKALALDLRSVQAPGFQDVPKSNGHYAAIAKLTELGVFSKAQKFNPNSPITRVQMAKMLVVAFDLQSDSVQTFKDVAKTSWYYETVGVLGALQIIRNAEKFEPAGLVTRAHFATFIERVITMKRADNTADIWDTWSTWDARGITTPVVKPVETPKAEDKPAPTNAAVQLSELMQRIKTLTGQIEDAREDVMAAQKALQRATEKETLKGIERAKTDLSTALQQLDQQLVQAKALLEQVGPSDAEMVTLAEKLKAEVQRGVKTAIESYAETFDKEYYEERFEDAADELVEAIKVTKKQLEQQSFSPLQKSYKELVASQKAAMSVRTSYKESNVKTLKVLDSELAELIKQADDVLEETEELFEDRLDEQLDNFKDSFKKALRALDDAVDDGKKGKIYDATEQVNELIWLAEKVVESYRDNPFEKLQNDLAKLQKEINGAKKDIVRAQK